MGVASFGFILSFEKAYRLLWGAEGDRCGIHAYCMVEQRSYHLRHLSHMDHRKCVVLIMAQGLGEGILL